MGETSRSRITGEGTNMRILEQNTAANVAYEVLYTTNAITNDGEIFSDHDIHEALEGLDIEREDTINPETKKKSEWFKTDLQTIIDVIDDYKMRAERTGTQDRIENFRLRDEQIEAVEKTKDYYNNALDDPNVEPAFLWNAKPRFGKTLTSYCFASEIKAQKVLIVTNRPAIADSWWTDFEKFGFIDEDQNDGKHRWVFTCSDAVKKRLDSPHGVFTREEQTKDEKLCNKNVVHFISLQDIKGLNTQDGSEDFKKKNKWIFDLNWDLVIIDESHEGADTSKALHVFDNVHHAFTLHLSGTPFKALASNRFNSNQIYNWSYTDEQDMKNNWKLEDGPNPYAELPKMSIYTYQLSRALEVTAEEARDEGAEYAFDLAEFLRVVKVDGEDKFLYEDKVKLFVKNLSNPSFQYPFSSNENREALHHTFWLLPGVKACEQMKKVLLEDDYFKGTYSPEDIIVAAGNGIKNVLDEVRRRIGTPGSSKHPLETRTITLSCGQLTTGVTVPEWTAVFMLNNCKSPSLYMQTAFRAQNPCKLPTSGNECILKENCYVFDFAPDRILQTLAEMADSGVSDSEHTTREEKVRMLINFLPVIAEDDEGKMKYLDANEVLTIPLKLITEEVINRGFMSNRLFENISGIFGCPKSIKEIIEKMDEAKGGKKVETDPKKKNKISNKPKVWVDNDKKIHINEDIVVATTNGLLGEKKYVLIDSDEGKEVRDIITEAKSQAMAAGHSNPTVNAEIKALEKKLPKLVTTLPEPEPKPGEPGYHEKEKPDEKPKHAEKTDEEKVRDRLRGFARTIPSFLMAYGSTETKLRNFGDNIPDQVFLELTNITKQEFLQLRDGMDYEMSDDNGKPIMENGKPKIGHFNGLFNEDVFNSAVSEFVEKRKELSAYYKTDSEEDIFEYIPPQANNQIFTPRKVVRMMVDTLEENNPGIFANTENTFIDLYMKSGMYITEIVKRIFDQTRDKYSSDTECVKHILENQVYGLAPSEILQAITQNYIFGFDEGAVISREHFKMIDAIPLAKNGSLGQTLNALFEKGGNMKFTAVVGNPPYQDGHNQIYTLFYTSALRIGDLVELIFPTSWQGVGSLNLLQNMNNKEIKRDSQIVQIDNRRNVFPEVQGVEWANIILWKRGYDNGLNGEQIVLTNGESRKTVLLPIEKSDIKRPNEVYTIVDKIRAVSNVTILDMCSSLRPYGLRTDALDKPEKYSISYDMEKGFHDYSIIGRKRGYGRITVYTDIQNIPTQTDSLEKWKIFIPQAWGAMDEEASGFLGGTYSDVLIGSPKECCTETFLEFGPLNTETEAHNARKYLLTKFFRLVLYKNKYSRLTTRNCYKDIPLQDFTNNSDINWSESIAGIDIQLYKKYGLTKNEIDFIELNIKAME